MALAAVPVLWMNEGCAVDIAKGLEETGAAVQTIEADSSPSEYSGEPVHFSGETEFSSPARDITLGVSEDSFLGLERKVEMFQYRERERGEGEDRRVEYTTEWSSMRIPSENFENSANYYNPQMPLSREKFYASGIKVGSYQFSDALTNQIRLNESLTPNQSMISNLPETYRSQAKLSGQYIYIGENPNNPQVGDIRISFDYSANKTVSVLGSVSGNEIVAHRTSRDTDVLRLADGNQSAEAMIAQAQTENVIRTWLVRFGGFLLMFFGIRQFVSPLTSPLRFIPFLGSLINAGITLMAFLFSLTVSITIIAIAWIVFRPLLGISLLLVAVAAIGFLIFRAKNKPVDPETDPAATAG